MLVFSVRKKKIVIFCKKKHTRNNDGNNVPRLCKHYSCSRTVRKVKANISTEASVPSGLLCQGIIPREVHPNSLFSSFQWLRFRLEKTDATDLWWKNEQDSPSALRGMQGAGGDKDGACGPLLAGEGLSTQRLPSSEPVGQLGLGCQFILRFATLKISGKPGKRPLCQFYSSENLH